MFPDTFHTAYSMVTFNHMPYSEALRRGKLNESIIDSMLEIPGILESDPESHKTALETLIREYGERIKLA
jgi:hypothetical protein